MKSQPIIIKGAGDLATGVAHRLFQCGFNVVMLDIQEPTAIRRTVAYAEAIYRGEITVEGVTGVLAQSLDDIEGILGNRKIAVLVDPTWESIRRLRPLAVVDAILAKVNLGTAITDAPITIGLGPGFKAGEDVRAVVETQRGHYLGKVIYHGSAIPNTGEPGEIGGYTKERILRAPVNGYFYNLKEIGSMVHAGELLARVGDTEILSPMDGVLRGILKKGIFASKGLKIGDVDPRAIIDHCFTISDKGRSIAGGVLEAILHLIDKGE